MLHHLTFLSLAQLIHSWDEEPEKIVFRPLHPYLPHDLPPVLNAFSPLGYFIFLTFYRHEMENEN